MGGARCRYSRGLGGDLVGGWGVVGDLDVMVLVLTFVLLWWYVTIHRGCRRHGISQRRMP